MRKIGYSVGRTTVRKRGCWCARFLPRDESRSRCKAGTRNPKTEFTRNRKTREGSSSATGRVTQWHTGQHASLLEGSTTVLHGGAGLGDAHVGCRGVSLQGVKMIAGADCKSTNEDSNTQHGTKKKESTSFPKDKYHAKRQHMVVIRQEESKRF